MFNNNRSEKRKPDYVPITDENNHTHKRFNKGLSNRSNFDEYRKTFIFNNNIFRSNRVSLVPKINNQFQMEATPKEKEAWIENWTQNRQYYSVPQSPQLKPINGKIISNY